jgi:phospholipase C
MMKLRCGAVLAIAILPACVQQPGARGLSQGLTPSVSSPFQAAVGAADQTGNAPQLLGSGKIKHVVIIFQENRTVDNLFNGLKGADTVQSGLDSTGQHVKLASELLTAPYDVDHEHKAVVVAYDDGHMDGFNLLQSNCGAGHKQCPPKDARPYAYVPRREVGPYFAMATQYAFADRMFQSNAGPSFPSHQYILSGTSTISKNSRLRAADNPMTAEQAFTGGCDSPKGSLVLLIDEGGGENHEAYPCFDRPALPDLIEAKSLSWRYYQAQPGADLWNGPDAIRHIRNSSDYSRHVVMPPSQIFTDIKNGSLDNVVWVTPTRAASDHAGNTDGSGPSWVASVVNAIGKSKYWNSTAIFVTWDDWGGWYDHVKPPQYNSYELGFRVPLVAISPYAKQGFVSHRQHEFGSILKFTEKAFGLGSLGTTDVRSDDLTDCFNFSQKPRQFKHIAAVLGPEYFLAHPFSDGPVDSDF